MYQRTGTPGPVLIALCILVASPAALAQRDQQPPPSPDHAHAPEALTTNFPSREASGTAWLPDATPMYGFHRQTYGWELMLHGNAFGQFLYESGEEHRHPDVGVVGLEFLAHAFAQLDALGGAGRKAQPGPGHLRPSLSQRHTAFLSPC